MLSPKVELHLHLEGALRPTTAYELLKKKNLDLPGDGSFECFLDSFVVKKPVTLMAFLQGFGIFLQGVIGDLEAIERMAYEFCENQAEQGVIYAEARYCPHLLLSDSLKTEKHDIHVPSKQEVNIKSVVEAVNKGMERGERDFGVIVRTILGCMRAKPEWSQDILDLCIEFKGKGVVGIDIAGCGAIAESVEGEDAESRMLDKDTIAVFEKAAELGIRRTVHAGESGPALMINKALDNLKAERIGHGYRVLEDETIYQRCLKNGVHFECCPTSSLLTSSVSLEGENKEHPIMRFARDGISFSISTDNPTVTNSQLNDEYVLLGKWGLTIAQMQEANINAMNHSFAELEVKNVILEKLYSAYGIKRN